MTRARSGSWLGRLAPVSALLLVGLTGCSVQSPVPPRGGAASESSSADPAAVRRAREVVGLVDRYGLHATGPEWERIKAQADRDLASAVTAADTWLPLMEVVSAGGGPHSRFLRAGNDAGTGGGSGRPTPTVTGERGGVATITVWNGPPMSEADADARIVSDGITARDDGACGWVVDLTRHRGGSLMPLLRGLAPLLPDGDVVVFRDRNGERDGSWTITDDRVLVVGGRPTPGLPSAPVTRWSVAQRVDPRPIAVLQSKQTASAAEGGVIAFKGLPNVRTFGEPTRGFTSGNTGFDGPAGSYVVLTGVTMVDRTGHDYAEKPIRPDTATPAGEAAAAARAWLATQGCR